MPAALVDPPARQALHRITDPHRWQLLALLGESDRRVGELTALVGTPQNLTSYHLRALRDAGLVTSRRSSADRRDTYYRLDVESLRAQMAAVAGGLLPAVRLVPAPLDVATLRSLRPRPRVLFLCTGNSARSQMAEALLQHRTGGAIAARSAGSHPKPLHPCAVRVMAERGIDIAGRSSKHLDRFLDERFDRVVTLCDKVREVCPSFPSAATAHWSMADPSVVEDGRDPYDAFVRTADEIEDRIDLLIAQLIAARAEERSTDG
jgi:protein-tyrosine-phosphatase/DNA-binding HxlR family transcriptional regulator